MIILLRQKIKVKGLKIFFTFNPFRLAKRDLVIIILIMTGFNLGTIFAYADSKQDL